LIYDFGTDSPKGSDDVVKNCKRILKVTFANRPGPLVGIYVTVGAYHYVGGSFEVESEPYNRVTDGKVTAIQT